MTRRVHLGDRWLGAHWAACTLFAAAAVLPSGCSAGSAASPAPAPSHAPSADAPAGAEVNSAHALRTLLATGQVDLTDTHGQTVVLDSTLALAMPDRLRLRASKMGQGVLDVTVKGDQLWIAAPDQPEVQERLAGADERAVRGLSVVLTVLGPDFRRSATPGAGGGQAASTVQGQAGGEAVVCEIDPDLRTVKRVVPAGGEGARAGLAIDLADYREFDGVMWPMRIVLTSPDGTIQVRSRKVQPNVELSDADLVPPTKAKQLK